MQTHKFPYTAAAGLLFAALTTFTGCKVAQNPDGPNKDRPRDNVRFAVEDTLRQNGVQFTPNFHFQWEDVEFVADGFDENLSVGWVFRPHIGDYDNERPKDMTDHELDRMKDLARERRVYFLVVTAKNPEAATEQAQAFVNKLLEARVITPKQTEAATTEKMDTSKDNRIEFEKMKTRTVTVKQPGQNESGEEVLENIKKEEEEKKAKKRDRFQETINELSGGGDDAEAAKKKKDKKKKKK